MTSVFIGIFYLKVKSRKRVFVNLTQMPDAKGYKKDAPPGAGTHAAPNAAARAARPVPQTVFAMEAVERESEFRQALLNLSHGRRFLLTVSQLTLGRCW
jgi:hypothetical protein